MASHLLLPVLPSNVSVKELVKNRIEEGISVQSITRFPELNIRVNQPGDVEICIYNSLGRRVWYSKNYYAAGDYILKITLPSGVYFVKSRIGEIKKVQKIVVIK